MGVGSLLTLLTMPGLILLIRLRGEKESVSESTRAVGSSGQTSEGLNRKVLQSPSVVCLRRCLMAATWFQFGKCRLPLPDVNTPVTLLPPHAHLCGGETKQTWTRRRSDEAVWAFFFFF